MRRNTTQRDVRDVVTGQPSRSPPAEWGPAVTAILVIVLTIVFLLVLEERRAESSGGRTQFLAEMTAGGTTGARSPVWSPSRSVHGRAYKPLGFGFVEFDWDPDAPGGVPGFDPWGSGES